MLDIATSFIRLVHLFQLPFSNPITRFYSSEPHLDAAAGLGIDQECPNVISCPASPPTGIDTCCINHPSGHFLLTQFWDALPALGKNDTWTIHGLWPDYCSGGFDAYCDKSRSRSPQEITRILSRASRNDANGLGSHPGLIEFMSEHWLSTSSRNSDLWSHEWNKHGTCVSTLEPRCYNSHDGDSKMKENDDAAVLDYFAHAAYLFTTLDTFSSLAEHGIVPSRSETYELAHLQRAIASTGHGMEVTFKCRNHNEVSEIWYHFNVRGSLRDAKSTWSDVPAKVFLPTPPDSSAGNCPSRVKYIPKGGDKNRPPPTSTLPIVTSTISSGPTSTAQPRWPFTGRGRLMVKVVADDGSSGRTVKADDDGFTGCLIRKGAWYAAHSRSSCATFTAHDDVLAEGDDGTGDSTYHLFTLESRYAPCSVAATGDRQHFECSHDLNFQSIFSNLNSTSKDEGESRILTFSTDHQDTFYAEAVPDGWKQQMIWRNPGVDQERPVQVQIWWEDIRD